MVKSARLMDSAGAINWCFSWSSLGCFVGLLLPFLVFPVWLNNADSVTALNTDNTWLRIGAAAWVAPALGLVLGDALGLDEGPALGEMLGDHYRWRKSLPYEGSAHIPFMIQAPERFGLRKGTVDSTPVCIEDIMPTLLDMADVEAPRPPLLANVRSVG